jgi:ectoine hydroxylase-related dioxygenase (phytanoyl-CoA dioxygenase family)
MSFNSLLLFLCLLVIIFPPGNSFDSRASVILATRQIHNCHHHQSSHLPLQAGKSNGKQDIDGMLSSIGLTPVSTKIQKATTEGPKNNTTRKQSENKAVSNHAKAKSSFISNQISLQIQLDYARNGHVALRNLIDPDMLQRIKIEVTDLAKREELNAWKQKVQVALNSAELAASCRTVDECRLQLESLGIDGVPFLQFFNTWTSLAAVKKLAFALGEAASTLLDAPEVRLYQDSIFWKRSVDGPTPWHVDAKMAPFDTQHMITFWIPLTSIPASGTGLLFCSKSHSDFALPYWNPLPDEEDGQPRSSNEWDRLENRYPEGIVDYMPMEMGDVTVHSGWTLHCANENDNSSDRLALAISFVDAKAELRHDALDDLGKGDNEDLNSYRQWATSVSPRSRFQHELVPIVWPLSVQKRR